MDPQVGKSPKTADGLSPSIPENQACDLFTNPQRWEQIVPADHPHVELEVGSGKGLFLQVAGAAFPERHYVGIELAAKFANRAAKRVAKAGLNNVVMLRGDAQRFLRDVVPDSSLMRLHVYFPDPWWRNKHKKRRVLNDQALRDIERSLRPGGELHFWTDVLDYYEHICGRVMEITRLAGPRFVPQRTASHSMDYTTHFERRARTHGQPVYRAIFDKCPAAAANPENQPRE